MHCINGFLLASCEPDGAATTLNDISTVLKELLVRVKRTEDEVRSLKKDRSYNSPAERKQVPLVVRVS